MSPIFEDFETIDSTAFFHRSDVHNIEIDEKEKTITWFFRVGAEVEVNCKKWIVNDERAQKLTNISTMKTFKQCVLHFRNLTKWQRQSFEFIIQNTSSSSRKEKEDMRGEITTTPDDTSCECSEGTLSCPYRYVKIDNKYYLRDTTYYDVNNKYCHDCGILNAKGNTHHPGCNMEICPACGAQLAFDDMHDEILVSDELPEGAKLIPAKYDAEFRKEQEKIRKWQIEEFSKVIDEETTTTEE